MKKTIGIALIVLFISGLSGCMFFGNSFDKVKSVKPSDLTAYSSSSRLPSTKTEAQDVLFNASSPALDYTTGEIIARNQSRNLSDSILKNIPEGSLLDRLFGLRTAAARTVSVDDNSIEDKLDLNVEILDEEVSDGGTGSMNVNSVNFTATGSAASTDTSMKMNIKFAGDGDISFDKYHVYSGDTYIIEDGQINLLGDGSLDMNINQTTSTIKYNIDIGLKLGLSISADYSSGYYGGKYIIEFGYKDKQTLSSLDTSSIESNVDASLSIKLYDNSNKLVQEYSYNTEDLTGLSSDISF